MRQHRTRGFVEILTDKGVVELQTFTCCHCNTVHKQAVGEDLAMCIKCYKPVCARCHQHGRCIPFEKKLERIESRASILKAAGIGG